MRRSQHNHVPAEEAAAAAETETATAAASLCAQRIRLRWHDLRCMYAPDQPNLLVPQRRDHSTSTCSKLG
jgi:hypothetical protein